MASQELIIKLLTQRFDALDKRLDVMDAKNDQRDLRVNTMDATNKKELADLKAEIDAAKTAWKVLTVVASIVATGIGFVVGIWPSITAWVNRS